MFGRLYLRPHLPGEPANEDHADPRRDLLVRADGARTVAVVFPDDGIKVRFIDASPQIWNDATSIHHAAADRAPQVGIGKVQAWAEPIQFPLFAHHDGEISTLRIPRFDATLIEIGEIVRDGSRAGEPPYSPSDSLTLSEWVKTWLP